MNDSYFKLTQKETHELNKNTLGGFLHNFISNSYNLQSKNIDIPQEKQFYTFEEFNELNINWEENYFTKILWDKMLIIKVNILMLLILLIVKIAIVLF